MTDLAQLVPPPTAAELVGMSDDDLLTLLAGTADLLDTVGTVQAQLWEVRLRIYQEARGREPAITQQALAAAARVSEVAVIQTLKKAAKKVADAAGTTG